MGVCTVCVCMHGCVCMGVYVYVCVCVHVYVEVFFFLQYNSAMGDKEYLYIDLVIILAMAFVSK